MSFKNPRNHHFIWTDLLNDIDVSSSSSWWQVANYLYRKKHGYSNYRNCLSRDHTQVRQDVYLDKRIQHYLANDDFEGSYKRKIERILDEMCHLLTSQSNPSRNIKLAGTFFLKCITKVYSNIYVNNHLFPLTGAFEMKHEQFKEQYLQITRELPVVILPTHRSYMDFLFISYIMTQYELPLPIVATGDNFKAMGKFITDYLKSTGAFLLRRTAGSKTDVEANLYYDILRAYVHSLLKGGEHPMEFFMEGTRTRSGQVLRPKTGLLSMVVDMLIDNIADIYILPVAINYQRPIEEQLYIGENTPEINMKKPKESAMNLLSAFKAIMKRQYGKVYVRFFEPFKLSQYFEEWKKVTGTVSIEDGDRNGVLHDFTNSLASKVCLEQVNNSILMPFNLITCSILANCFMQDFDELKPSMTVSGQTQLDAISTARIPFKRIVEDFRHLEDLLQATQTKFVPGWKSHIEIIEEFRLDRGNVVRYDDSRKYIEFDLDAFTFQTMLYYSNQVIQILLPVAICFLIPFEQTSDMERWQRYREIRSLLSYEFFANESFMQQEFDAALKAMIEKGSNIPNETRKLIAKHLRYSIQSYLRFYHYMLLHNSLDRNNFFEVGRQLAGEKLATFFISKDTLRNMISLAKDQGALEVTYKDLPKKDGETRSKREEIVTLKNKDKLEKLLDRFKAIQSDVTNVISRL